MTFWPRRVQRRLVTLQTLVLPQSKNTNVLSDENAIAKAFLCDRILANYNIPPDLSFTTSTTCIYTVLTKKPSTPFQTASGHHSSKAQKNLFRATYTRYKRHKSTQQLRVYWLIWLVSFSFPFCSGLGTHFTHRMNQTRARCTMMYTVYACRNQHASGAVRGRFNTDPLA